MLMRNKSIADIQNHLGHENINSTMIYLKLDLSKRKEIQKNYMDYMQTVIDEDEKINDLIDWEKDQEVVEWLDSLWLENDLIVLDEKIIIINIENNGKEQWLNYINK